MLIENNLVCIWIMGKSMPFEALNQELVLGREDVKDKIERMTKRQVHPGQPGRPRVEEEQAVYYVI